ncbi:MAG TPA: FG-GAP-like repeat-containing protein [Verrucomicrobiae bacterium]|nr:FG-GAP-like repeat-containing protein [Verrucomicrobiae bacterium]
MLPGVAFLLLMVAMPACSKKNADPFTQLMNRGNGFLEQGDVTNAISTYLEATAIAPESLDLRLNLANAWLRAGGFTNAIEQCRQALDLDHNSAAAYYLMGCAYLHLNQADPAVQALQQSQQIDPAVTALNFQLGLAQDLLGNKEAAIKEFETVVRFEPEHRSAHYQLSRLYQRLGRTAAAAQAMQKHQDVQAKYAGSPATAATFEKCKYTAPRIVFVLEQPDQRGIPVRFVEATASAIAQASNYRGPVAVVDFNHDGRNSLFVMEGNGFRLLGNVGGRFEPLGDLLPGQPGATYRRALVGDLNNDRLEDLVVLGEQASHVFNFATNGRVREITPMTGLKAMQAHDGLLADLDFTGKLDLLTILPERRGLRVYRNLGNAFFKDDTDASGLPAALPGAEQLAVEDLNNEDVPGVLIAQTGKPPAFFAKQRAGTFTATNAATNWPVGSVLATGDLNNDLRSDLVIATASQLEFIFAGNQSRSAVSLQGLQARRIVLLDYDNDGWLDVVAYGNGLRVWRNLGVKGFVDVTSTSGLDKVKAVDSVVAADFDADGDTDLILSTAKGLQLWRNDGGNANHQLKVRLAGNRSNASALGVRVELAAGNWRAIRTLQQPPLEIGTGKHDKLDALKVRWFDLSSTLVDLPVQTNLLTLDELTLPSGSCPYLYAWDGQEFTFVTDMLGAAPLGLPLSHTRYIEADPEEFLSLGDEKRFPPRNGAYEIRLTEELREVLYLDEASLVVVDHPEGTVVLPTSKLLPGKPFPPHQLWTLRPLATLKKATRSDGLDVTDALAKTDTQMVSPVQLREPQLRGLAEPFSVTMDFGALPTKSPLVLALNGWLRFGGGMANIAASLDPNLPFPFPTLEAELPDGSWKKLDVNVGAPSGKTKTIVVDLENKLPPGTRQLRLTTAFEIHWDSAICCERVSAGSNQHLALLPDQTDLRWRGFSAFKDLPADQPLTPDYTNVHSAPPWRRTPSGWCTRYGEVTELVQTSDDALVLLNGGDELALSFSAAKLPPKPAGFIRDFFLHVIGWDKDADFHVGQGWRVEPFPFRGMDDQAYDQLVRPAGAKGEWIRKYNTRWVGPMVLTRKSDH